MKKLLLIELNEINFEVVSAYIKAGADLPGLEALFKRTWTHTSSEESYDLLEPWIQWPSVHTGMPYGGHGIYRLGDSVDCTEEQIFEALEKKGFTVGAISPMNATNNTRAPAFFIPDPWTSTRPDDHWANRLLTNVLIQAVNDNAQSKLTLRTIVSLAVCFVNFVSPKKYVSFAAAALQALRKPWKRAIFLDRFLWEVHATLLKRKAPNFSVIFLNAGAHIQHHYLLNSKHAQSSTISNPDWYVSSETDPVLEMLESYSDMLLELPGDYEFLIATGLSQVPYAKPEFYYRLKDHREFLRLVGVEFLTVKPRMTRDFEIKFASEADAMIAERQLSQVLIDGLDPMFGEIDNRGSSLFVVLTYPKEIAETTTISLLGRSHKALEYVTFVAIKNGAHNGKGYAFFSNGIEAFAPSDGAHVASLHACIESFFAGDAHAAEYPSV